MLGLHGFPKAVEGTSLESNFKHNVPSRGHAVRLYQRAVAREQLGSAAPILDKDERTVAMQHELFRLYYEDTAKHMLSVAKPPMAIKNEAFDEEEEFSEIPMGTRTGEKKKVPVSEEGGL